MCVSFLASGCGEKHTYAVIKERNALKQDGFTVRYINICRKTKFSKFGSVHYYYEF